MKKIDMETVRGNAFPKGKPRAPHARPSYSPPPEALVDRILGMVITVGLALFALFVPLSIAGAQIGGGLAFAGVVGLIVRRRLPVLGTPLLLPFLVLVIAALLSVAMNGALRGILPATQWRNGLAFFAVVLGLRASRAPERELRLVLMLLLVFTGAVLAVAIGLVQVVKPFDPSYVLGLHAQPYVVAAPDAPGLNAALGFFNSRLTFGHVLCALFAVALGLLASGSLAGRGRTLLIALAVLLLAGIAATFSRSSYLGAAVAGGAVVLAAAAVRPRLALGLGLALLLVGGAAVSLWPGMTRRLASAVDLERNAERVFIWERAAEMIQDHPVFGVGFGNYPEAARAYYQKADPEFVMRTWAHNAELTALVEGGPLLLLAMCWVFAAALAAVMRRLRIAKAGSLEHGLALGALGALAMAAVAAQFHDLLYDGEAVFALSFALGIGLSPGKENESRSG